MSVQKSEKKGGGVGEGREKGKSEAGEREIEGLKEMKKEKKDWQRDRLGQRGGDLCRILQQR